MIKLVRDMDSFPRSRPQRDGPALRATTIIKFGNYLLDKNVNTSYVSGTLWPIVQLVCLCFAYALFQSGLITTNTRLFARI